MAHVLVRHKVADFAKWKTFHDAHLPARQRAGIAEEYLLRNAQNPNEVFVLFKSSDIKKAQEFAGSDDLRDTMKRAGVIDKPDVYFLS